MKCHVASCTNEARPKVGRSGPAPKACVAHAPDKALGFARGSRDAVPPRAAPPSVPALELAARSSSLPPGQKQALAAALRDVARGVQKALTILSQGPGAWTCPSCGPVMGEPLHGADERMHCPNDGCDAEVAVSGVREDAPGASAGGGEKSRGVIGAAWRGRAGTVVVPGEA